MAGFASRGPLCLHKYPEYGFANLHYPNRYCELYGNTKQVALQERSSAPTLVVHVAVVLNCGREGEGSKCIQVDIRSNRSQVRCSKCSTQQNMSLLRSTIWPRTQFFALLLLLVVSSPVPSQPASPTIHPKPNTVILYKPIRVFLQCLRFALYLHYIIY